MLLYFLACLCDLIIMISDVAIPGINFLVIQSFTFPSTALSRDETSGSLKTSPALALSTAPRPLLEPILLPQVPASPPWCQATRGTSSRAMGVAMGRAMQHMAMEHHTTRIGATRHSKGTMGTGSRAGAPTATIMARDKTYQPITLLGFYYQFIVTNSSNLIKVSMVYLLLLFS